MMMTKISASTNERRRDGHWASFLRDEDGATAIEYGLIASLIILGIIGAVTTFSENTSGMYTNISDTLASG